MALSERSSRVKDFVECVCTSDRLRGQITDHRILKASQAEYAEIRRPWPGAIAKLLTERSIRLFSHQAEAINHIRAGHSVVVSTPTASGKSLIYNLPVLEECLMDPDAHALYLFPLKALAQDQLLSFNELTRLWPEEARPKVRLYDGDTDDSQRREIRANPPSVLITNPEMLHLAILPWHSQWSTFLAGLRIIVVDEAHTYRGIFGSHMAQVFRRLNRIVGRYAPPPTWVLASATVGNPEELASKLTDAAPANRPVSIGKSGAPQGERHFIFINPLLSPSTTAIDLLSTALNLNLRTIVYCRSRKMTELISIWARNSSPPGSQGRISSYRAGFLPEERREIERKMASGELSCVISTSALELGIDIGGLDICILVGYPGTIMSTMQRGGRVGRAQQESCVLMVAGEDALDQFVINNADDFFRRPPERAVLNPDNEVILERHLECAASELPLSVHEPWLADEAAARCVEKLVREGKLLRSRDGQSLISPRKSPQRDISLRSGGQSCVIEAQDGRIIGVIDAFRAWHEAHPGAVYLHHGKSYVITTLDVDRGRIMAVEEKVPWFTRPRSNKTTVILKEYERKSLGRLLALLGRFRITDTVTGYEKRSTSGNQLLGIHPLTNPPQIFETEGLCFVIPDAIRTALENEFIHFMGSIHAMEHAIIGLLPLQVMADRNDFGGISTTLHPQLGFAAVFVYDGIPGGAGLSREAFREAKKILEDTYQAIRTCPCEAGCPSCVHSPKCGSGNRPLSKDGAIRLLNELLLEGHEGDELAKDLVIPPAPDFQPLTSQERKTYAGTADQNLSATVATDSFSPKSPPAHYIVFDVETRLSAKEVGGWNHADKMGVSVCVAYDSLEDRFLRFEQHQLPELFRRFQQCELIVGFNSLRFDYRVLAPFTDIPLHSLPSLDLLKEVNNRLKYRLSLNTLAQATLNVPKSANGLIALAWWKEGKIDEIAHYCEMDVRLTRDLYLFGLEHGYLLFTAKSGQIVRLPVSF